MTVRLLKESRTCCEQGLHVDRMRSWSKEVPSHIVDLRWPEASGLRTGSRPRQLCGQDKLAAMVVLILCLASGTSSLGPSYNYNCSDKNIVPLNLTEGVCCPSDHNNIYFKRCSLVDARPNLTATVRRQKSRVNDMQLHTPIFNKEGHIAGELSWMYLGIGNTKKIPTRGFLVTIAFEGTDDGQLHAPDIFVKDCFLVPAKSNSNKVSIQLSTNCSKYPTFSCLESIVLREVYMRGENTSPPKIRVEVKTIPWGTPRSTVFTLKTCEQLECNTIVVQAGSKLQCHGTTSPKKIPELLCDCNGLKPIDFDARYSMETGKVTILWQMASDLGHPLKDVKFYRIHIAPFKEATSELDVDYKNMSTDEIHQATQRKFVKYRPELRKRSGFEVLMSTFDLNDNRGTVRRVVQLPPPTEAPLIPVAASPRSIATNTTNASSVNITESSQPTARIPLSSPSAASTHPAGRVGDTNKSYIAVSISLLLVMLAFVLTLLAVVLNNRWKSMPNKKKQPRNYSNRSSTAMWWNHSESNNQEADTTSSVPVYISYARFLQQHRKDVRVFADLLRCDAHVDTILDMYCENEVAVDRVSWLNDSMQRSKFIIVVLSKHHSMLMDADLAKDTADDDDFALCQMETKNIMSCLLRPEQEQEVIPVYFAPKPLPFKLPLCLGNCKVYYLGDSPSSSPDFLDLKYRLNGVEKLAPPV